MDWAVHLPHLGRNVARESLIEFAQECEHLGFHSAFTSDHVCWPAEVNSKYPYNADGSFPATPDMGWLDPIGTLLFVAGCTERLRLGFTVLILPYRPPVATAKQLATLDVVSNGRLILGVGVGWMREEAEVLGMPWDNRGARTDEQLEIFERLFTDPTPSYSGRFYEFPEISFEPKPVQEHIPVWIGGSSEPAFRRVARFGDCYHAAFQPIETVAADWQLVQRFVGEAGRDPESVSLSVRLYLDPGQVMKPELSIGGSAERMRDTIGRWADIGVDHVVVDITAPGGPDGRLDALRELMTEVAAG